jgi:hypothetical protein
MTTQNLLLKAFPVEDANPVENGTDSESDDFTTSDARYVLDVTRNYEYLLCCGQHWIIVLCSYRSLDAVDCIEEMVSSLLTQLAFSGCATPSALLDSTIGSSGCESEGIGGNMQNFLTKSKIELRLVDRSKESAAGQAFLMG